MATILIPLQFPFLSSQMLRSKHGHGSKCYGRNKKKITRNTQKRNAYKLCANCMISKWWKKRTNEQQNKSHPDWNKILQSSHTHTCTHGLELRAVISRAFISQFLSPSLCERSCVSVVLILSFFLWLLFLSGPSTLKVSSHANCSYRNILLHFIVVEFYDCDAQRTPRHYNKRKQQQQQQQPSTEGQMQAWIDKPTHIHKRI